jgi:hypothetical protein
LSYIESALKRKRLHYLRASAYTCLETAISSFQRGDRGQGGRGQTGALSDKQFIRSVSVAQSLWERDLTEEAALLLNWLVALISVNEEYIFDDTRRQESPPSPPRLMSSGRLSGHLQLAGLLFQTGEWSAARQLLEANIFQVCAQDTDTTSDEQQERATLPVRVQCQESCSLQFLSAFSTLSSHARSKDYSEENQDWTVEVNVAGGEGAPEWFGGGHDTLQDPLAERGEGGGRG